MRRLCLSFSLCGGEARRDRRLQLELVDVLRDAGRGSATPTDPRQGRNIGLSAIVAINDREFMVLERDNRGIGVDDPAGSSVVGAKRVYKIDVAGTTDVSAVNPLPNDLAGIVPVTKSAVFMDLTADTVLPNARQPEKWEGITIGPRLRNGAHVTSPATTTTTRSRRTPATCSSTCMSTSMATAFSAISIGRRANGVEVGPVPSGYVLIPGVLHAYKASAADLAGYERPARQRSDDDDDDDD